MLRPIYKMSNILHIVRIKLGVKKYIVYKKYLILIFHFGFVLY